MSLNPGKWFERNNEPQRLKPLSVAHPIGTTEVVPFPSRNLHSARGADNFKTKARAGRSRLLYSELMFARNSPFDLVLLNLSISNSIASTGDRGFSTLRNTQMRVRSSFGISNSSLRVPER
jgi:hypothetical protein